MSESLDDFLAGWILHDAKLITFRLLSRARGLHVQDAKTALQNFYERKSKKSPLALSAIYVLKGTLKQDVRGIHAYKREAADNDGDIAMTDEAAGTSASQGQNAPESIPRKQFLLVSADKLEETKDRFSSLTTAHIYSLAPGPDPQASSSSSARAETTSLAEAARKQLPLLATVQHDLHSNREYVMAWEKARRGRALGVIWNEDTVEDFSPSAAPAARASIAGPSVKKPAQKEKASEKPVKVEAAKVEKKSSSSKLDSKASSSSKTDSKASSKQALENMLFPKSEPVPKAETPAAVKKTSETSSKAAATTKTSATTSKRTTSGAQKRSVPEPEDDEEEEDRKADDGVSQVKRRVKKMRTVTKTERSKDERGYTVRKNVEVEEEYTTDESSDEVQARPKPSKMAKKTAAATSSSSSSSSRKASTTKAARAPSPSPSPSPPPPPKPAPKPAQKPAPAPPPAPAKAKASSSTFGANRAGSGSGSGSGSGAAKKPVDKRQQTLGSFFKKKT